MRIFKYFMAVIFILFLSIPVFGSSQHDNVTYYFLSSEKKQLPGPLQKDIMSNMMYILNGLSGMK